MDVDASGDLAIVQFEQGVAGMWQGWTGRQSQSVGPGPREPKCCTG